MRESKAAEMAKEDGREAEAVAKEEERKRAEAEKAAKEAEEKKAVDAKIDAFLKEYLGVQFGDSIDKYPEVFVKQHPNKRVIPVLKKFRYFDKAYGEFYEGKLVRIGFYVDIENKYSVDSTNEKINQAVADLAVVFGLEDSAFIGSEFGETSRLPVRTGSFTFKSPSRTSYYCGKIFMNNTSPGVLARAHFEMGKLSPGYRRYEVYIANNGLKTRLEEAKRQADEEARLKKNATGETLPDPE